MALYIKSDGTTPSVVGFSSSTSVRADGAVTATDPTDIMRLLCAGYVPLQCSPGGRMYYGEARFEFKQHSGLVPVLL